MLTNQMFTLITRLIFSRWTSDYAEHASPYEDSIWARLGPLRLSVNSCFVLDHADASVSMHLPLPGGKLSVSYTVCRGGELVRRPGWVVDWRQA